MSAGSFSLLDILGHSESPYRLELLHRFVTVASYVRKLSWVNSGDQDTCYQTEKHDQGAKLDFQNVDSSCVRSVVAAPALTSSRLLDSCTFPISHIFPISRDKVDSSEDEYNSSVQRGCQYRCWIAIRVVFYYNQVYVFIVFKFYMFRLLNFMFRLDLDAGEITDQYPA